MKQRIRWFTLEAPGDALSGLGRRMLSDEYAEEKGGGFRIEIARRGETVGAFIERLESIEEVEDPFGRVLKFRRVEYSKVRFRLGGGRPNLELVDPPRSCKSFFAKLGSLLKHELSVEPVRPNVPQWIKEVERTVGRVRITAMAVGNVTVSVTSSADIVLTGSDDVRAEMRNLLAGRRHVVAAATLEWGARSAPIVCELSRNGANLSGDQGEDLVTALRTTLERSLD